MSDRAYAKVPAQQKMSIGSSPKSSLLQRTCACGQHTIAGGECEACRKERVGVLQRRAAISNEPTTVPPIASEVQRSPRQPLDVGTRAFIEPRFGHHFSRISTYTSTAGAVQTKLAINRLGDQCEQEYNAREGMMSAPFSLPVAPGLQFDFARIPIKTPPIQRKPTISSPGDAYEREADEVADKVMRLAEPGPIASGPAAIQPKCLECEDEEKKPIQTKREALANAETALDAGAAVRAAEWGGAPLPREVRSYFEPRFGYDFSRVRVHADGVASDGARAVKARAYTIGCDIVFGSGEYAPAMMEGKRLLAHELTHVVQQGAAPAAGQSPTWSAMVPSATGAPGIQRKLECNLEPIEKECAGAASACSSAKDYCATKYPNSKDLDKLHADAVTGANGYKSKFPNAADNLLHFLDGSGTEKVMKVDIFRDHPATQQK